MSTISTALATALSTLATAKGESLTYATSVGGSHSVLTGFVLHQDRIAEPSYDEHDRADSQKMTATLKGPASPVLALGYEIVDSITGWHWAVESCKSDVQQVCRLMRRVPLTHGPNRGGAA